MLGWQYRSPSPLITYVRWMGTPCSLPAHLSRATAEFPCLHTARCLTQPNLRSPRISSLHSSHSTHQQWSAKSDSEQAFVVWRSWKSHHTVTADNFSTASGSKPTQGRPSPGTSRSLPSSFVSPLQPVSLFWQTDAAAASPFHTSSLWLSFFHA